LTWEVRDGSKALFWEDSWDGHSILSEREELEKAREVTTQRWGGKVRDYIEPPTPGNGALATWKNIRTLGLEDRVVASFEEVLSNRRIILRARTDVLRWNASP